MSTSPPAVGATTPPPPLQPHGTHLPGPSDLHAVPAPMPMPIPAPSATNGNGHPTLDNALAQVTAHVNAHANSHAHDVNGNVNNARAPPAPPVAAAPVPTNAPSPAFVKKGAAAGGSKAKKPIDATENAKLVAARLVQLETEHAGEKDQEAEIGRCLLPSASCLGGCESSICGLCLSYLHGIYVCGGPVASAGRALSGKPCSTRSCLIYDKLDDAHSCMRVLQMAL